MKTDATIEFRCPECGCREHHSGKITEGVIYCSGSNKEDPAGVCGAKWKKGEHWKCFAVIRQCVSKTDYEFYLEKSEHSA